MNKLTKATAAIMLIASIVGFVGCKSTNVSNGKKHTHEYVDLGLPSGTLWATCNIGADKPEDYGDYYAWGETRTKTTYGLGNYKYSNGDYDKLTKYCHNSDFGDNGFTDYLTTLQSDDDPATVNWGSGWCTPSKDQWYELLNNTNNTWTTQNGVEGSLFTSKKNGQTLFLPAAGLRVDSGHPCHVSCNYWSRSLYTNNPNCAWYLDFNYMGIYGMRYTSRPAGFSVRPVRQK